MSVGSMRSAWQGMQWRGQRADCKSGLNYTPSASSSLREFRIGSCEKPPVTQTTKPKFLQKDLVAPQVEQTVDLDHRRLSQLRFTLVIQEGKSRVYEVFADLSPEFIKESEHEVLLFFYSY